MPLIYKTPHQKIFTEKKDLNLFLLKIIDLLVYKHILLPEILDLPSDEAGLDKFIKVWTQTEALENINKILFPPQVNDLKSLAFVKLQTSEEGISLLNYFNVRISLGFKVNDLTNIFTQLTLEPTLSNPFSKSAPTASETPTNEFLFCYLNLWPHGSTWRLTISKGDSDYYQYNILAQDLISDHFQNGIYTPKPDYKED